jgi:hypothetical protein
VGGGGAFTAIGACPLSRVSSVGFRAHRLTGGRVPDDRYPAWPAAFVRPTGMASDNREGQRPEPRQVPPRRPVVLPRSPADERGDAPEDRNPRPGPLLGREHGGSRYRSRLVPVTRRRREAHRTPADSGPASSWNAYLLVRVNGGPDRCRRARSLSTQARFPGPEWFLRPSPPSSIKKADAAGHLGSVPPRRLTRQRASRHGRAALHLVFRRLRSNSLGAQVIYLRAPLTLLLYDSQRGRQVDGCTSANLSRWWNG